MILRLIIAFTRWVWSVSPAFVTPEQPLGEWGAVMIFGAMLDVLALVGVTGTIVMWYTGRDKK